MNKNVEVTVVINRNKRAQSVSFGELYVGAEIDKNAPANKHDQGS